ncbi:ATP-binding protein [Citrobacter sp. Cf112]|uniref:NACHT domain-containing protein n=1 Tax=Citrobacter sp. Cf112 TaxID=2985065 RepID=UPI002577D78B|nr:ATP-binding protein [Citrobacter sp. Cf112]MDM3174405.1 ATP-binding protein [Citrobacter sp. Cf112]
MLNFSKINAFEMGQRESFEELICLLAKREHHEGTMKFQRIEGSGGDGGVEALWVASDGSKIGYQAKYFLQLGHKQWSQIDESVKRALEVHPELTNYVVALPINLTNKRTFLGLGKSAWEKWEDRVKTWTGWAQKKGLSVKFEPWAATDINEMLLREENLGLIHHWFGEQVLGLTWFKKHFLIAKGLLDDRYSPSEHVHVSIEAMFDAMVRGASTMSQVREYYTKLRKQHFSLIDFNKLPLQPSQADIDNAEQALISLLNTEKVFSPNVRDEWHTTAVLDALDDYSNSLHPLEIVLSAIRQNSKTDSEIPTLRSIEESMSKARSAIYKLQSFTDSKNLHAECARYAVVTGPAGAGKSHLLAHIADIRLSMEEPTILLIGQSFSNTDVWGQIGALLDIPEKTASEILGLLSAAAERQGKRALIMIDAINEGVGSDFWRDRIVGLLKQAEAYPDLAFVFSCREEYLSFAFPRSVIDEACVFRIEGFQTIEEMEAAALKYLDSKGIARPNTPWLSPEFRNPLFLKSTSEALQIKGEVEFPKGLHGISQLMSFYLDSLSMRTGLASVDYDLLASAIKKAVQSIAGKMVETGEDFVQLMEADKIVNEEFAHLPKSQNSTWLGVLIRSSVLRRDPPPFNEDNDPLNPLQDRIRFAFQRFQDHLMAQAIVFKLISGRLHTAFEAGGELLFLFYDKDVRNGFSYKHAGLLGALSTLYPEKFSVEFIDTIPEGLSLWKDNHILQEAYETSCKWRRLDAFTARSIELFNMLDERWINKLGLLIEVSMTINHPWNAIFLHNWLFDQEMPKRDSYWTNWVNWASNEEGNQVERLISWANGTANADTRHLELAGLVIAWLLTSSRRTTRDQASKALTSIFLRQSSSFQFVLEKLSKCNDPYLLERVYSAAFGSCCIDQSIDRLSSYSSNVWRVVFSYGEPPVALLTRDYALGIIELAKAKNYLSTEVDYERCLPPYSSVIPEFELTSEAVEEIANARGSKTIFSSASSEWGDFGKYIIPSRVKTFLATPLADPAPISADKVKEKFIEEVISPSVERVEAFDTFNKIRAKPRMWLLRYITSQDISDDEADKSESEATAELLASRIKIEELLSESEKLRFMKDYLNEGGDYSQYKHVDVQQCRLWVTKRAYELGWSSELFPRDGYGNYGSRHENDFERIGKKYQWIALDEITARLSDNFWYLNEWPEAPLIYQYSSQDFRRDLEPTILPSHPRFSAQSNADEDWMIDPIIRLPEVSESDLKAWPFTEDPTESFQNKLQRIDIKGKKWRILYEYNCERQNYPESQRGMHNVRYEEFRFIYCTFVKSNDIGNFVADLKEHQSLDVTDLQPQDYTDGPFFLETYWRDTWKSEQFTRELRRSSGVKFSNSVARYNWESHLDKTMQDGFEVYMPQRWLADGLSIKLAEDSTRSWIDIAGNEIIKVLGPVKNASAVLICEEALEKYCAKAALTPFWLLIGERNTWPGGDNDQSCWRRSEGAWWQQNDEWEHIAWNRDTKR